MAVYMSYLKLVTQTERIPASAAARHATGTTSETCFLISALHGSNKYKILYIKLLWAGIKFVILFSYACWLLVLWWFLLVWLASVQTLLINYQFFFSFLFAIKRENILRTTKSALIEFSHSVSKAKILARGFTAVSEY